MVSSSQLTIRTERLGRSLSGPLSFGPLNRTVLQRHYGVFADAHAAFLRARSRAGAHSQSQCAAFDLNASRSTRISDAPSQSASSVCVKNSFTAIGLPWSDNRPGRGNIKQPPDSF